MLFGGLYYKMVIHKLIAFLRYNTFFVLSSGCSETQPNSDVKANTYHFVSIYEYYLFHQFLLCFLHIWYIICTKTVANNHQAIKCDKWNLWHHIKCIKINKPMTTYIQTILIDSANSAIKNSFLSRYWGWKLGLCNSW